MYPSILPSIRPHTHPIPTTHPSRTQPHTHPKYTLESIQFSLLPQIFFFNLITSASGIHTRGIWKVLLSMVFYLSNRFTNPIRFDIILKNYLSSMLLHKFHEDIIMQTRQILLRIHILFVYWKMQNFSGKYNIKQCS